jgi:hypothetical protein
MVPALARPALARLGCSAGASARDRAGCTPLHYAAARAHREVCSALIGAPAPASGFSTLEYP